MVVSCPKCKVRLKVDETKLSPGGSRFKCPKCATVLVVKKPAVQAKKVLGHNKILVGHSNPDTTKKIVSLLSDYGYDMVTAADGIDVMVKALKELPFLSIIEVALPKIYGFEVCKRLKMRAETKGMKFILIPSIYDKNRYRRDPVSLYGADDYIEDHDLAAQLVEKVQRLHGSGRGETSQQTVQTETQPSRPEREKPSPGPATGTPASPGTEGGADQRIEKAKRLARTIISDIYLYNSAKLDDSVRNGTFYEVFAAELKEGKKLYDLRIPQEIRDIDDFYSHAIENFISNRKKRSSDL